MGRESYLNIIDFFKREVCKAENGVKAPESELCDRVAIEGNSQVVQASHYTQCIDLL